MNVAHLTVVETLYYQMSNEQPHTAAASYRLDLNPPKSAQQPYVRRMFVGQEKESLDTGWVTVCSALVIVNIAKVRQRHPTDQERAVDESEVLHLMLDDMVLTELAPGESIRFKPTKSVMGKLTVRAPVGEVAYQIYAFPG